MNSDHLVSPVPSEDATARDAARYRWLRDYAHVDIGCGTEGFLCFGAAIYGEKWSRMYDDNGRPTGEEVDAAIDAAIAGATA